MRSYYTERVKVYNLQKLSFIQWWWLKTYDGITSIDLVEYQDNVNSYRKIGNARKVSFYALSLH